MRIFKAILRRLTGSDIRALRAEVAELKATHAQIAEVVMNLNHDITTTQQQNTTMMMMMMQKEKYYSCYREVQACRL